MVRNHRCLFMRCRVFGHWLWISCSMAKKKSKLGMVKFIQSRAYRKMVVRRFERKGYYPIGTPLFKYQGMFSQGIKETKI